jgi:hypothetical protein
MTEQAPEKLFPAEEPKQMLRIRQKITSTGKLSKKTAIKQSDLWQAARLVEKIHSQLNAGYSCNTQPLAELVNSVLSFLKDVVDVDDNTSRGSDLSTPRDQPEV